MESARKSTRLRSVDLYEVFCAVLYLLRTGCRWRALPRGFLKWRVHAYFAIWSAPREGGSLLKIAKRSELHTFKLMAQRWVVERSFAWLEKNRRLWKNCERLLNTCLQFVHLAVLASHQS